MAQARATEVSISAAREVYRPVAVRGSQVYFLIDNLNALDRWVRGVAWLLAAAVVLCSRRWLARKQPHNALPNH